MVFSSYTVIFSFFHKHILCTVAVLLMKFLNFFSVLSKRIQHTISAVNTTHIFLYFSHIYIYIFFLTVFFLFFKHFLFIFFIFFIYLVGLQLFNRISGKSCFLAAIFTWLKIKIFGLPLQYCSIA